MKMQYKLVAISALAATAFAQNQSASASQSVEDLVSVISVLQTALPSSLIQEALTNSAAVSSEIASEFSAGSTPAWFTALPSDVQTYLVPVASFPNATGSVISAGPTNSANSTGNSTTLSRTSTRGPTTITSTATNSGSGSGSNNGASATQGESSSSTGGASMPTNIMGLGLAGAVGLVGVLAL
ncbi:hypothetical protein M409DRAFT_27356 [Zasmidium cellare ATCC 36951]|uniref:FAS1 domain-containing protein n=1 Tax=Zasmidium cellare ATCC 36951 TaxID=1080233 RepID=A0A6A6C8X4_ZASCE|nr:uncharacterized protein M409DRAFT_27356 [Zasmidium cellare ATCC 36951]KAF2162352.1 hypothetical protein M409DRAFT_27356 [Zasmidium cellare ATCC 36951]